MTPPNHLSHPRLVVDCQSLLAGRDVEPDVDIANLVYLGDVIDTDVEDGDRLRACVRAVQRQRPAHVPTALRAGFAALPIDIYQPGLRLFSAVDDRPDISPAPFEQMRAEPEFFGLVHVVVTTTWAV